MRKSDCQLAIRIILNREAIYSPFSNAVDKCRNIIDSLNNIKIVFVKLSGLQIGLHGHHVLCQVVLPVGVLSLLSFIAFYMLIWVNENLTFLKKSLIDIWNVYLMEFFNLCYSFYWWLLQHEFHVTEKTEERPAATNAFELISMLWGTQSWKSFSM